MTDETRIIKKYPNRRLYDTSLSQYITLEDIKVLVLDNVDFSVIDAKTEKDLTHSTLMQIIIEQEEKGTPILTTEALRNLIRFDDNKLRQLLGPYLEQSLAFFITQHKEFRGKVSKVIQATPLAFVSDIADKNLTLWKNVYKSVTGGKGAKKK